MPLCSMVVGEELMPVELRVSTSRVSRVSRVILLIFIDAVFFIVKKDTALNLKECHYI